MITISKHSEIKSVLSKGKKFVFTNFIVLCRENYLNYPRYAVIVSKKVSKRAVDRNRAKRLIRELIRKNRDILSNIGGVDLVFVVRKNILGKNLFDINPDFKEMLEKLKDDCKTDNKPYKTV